MIFNNIGKFCKYFRSEILKMTLNEMSNNVNIKITTLSSFENGRSTNYNHLIRYYRLGDDEQKKFFRDNLPLWGFKNARRRIFNRIIRYDTRLSR